MDPQTTYQEWTLALLEERSEDAKEHYAALRSWLDKGGFEPPKWQNQLARKQFFQFNPVTGRL